MASVVLFFLLGTTMFLTASAGVADQGLATDSSMTNTGFSKPGETLFSSHWGTNSTVNPLGESNRDAIFSNNPVSGNYLKGIDYNFNIEEGSTIHGIEVMIEHATWNGNNYWANISVELEFNGRSTTTNTGKWDYVSGTLHSGWDDNFRNVTLGSSSDTWGRTWSTDDLANNNFAVRISLLSVHSSASESVDIAWVKVHYSTPLKPARIELSSPADVSIPQDQTHEINFSWNISFFSGDLIDLETEVQLRLLFNGTEYYVAENRVYAANNTVFTIHSETSIYQLGAYLGPLGEVFGGVGFVNITLVATLHDTLAIPVVSVTNSVFLTIEEVVSSPTETSVRISQPGDISLFVDQLSEFAVTWNTSFSLGSGVDPTTQLKVELLVGEVLYGTTEGVLLLSNNTSFTIDSNTSLYNSGTYVGTVGGLLSEPGTYYIALVGSINPVGAPSVSSSSGVTVDVMPNDADQEVGDAYIEGLPSHLDYQITLQQNLTIRLSPSLLNATGHEFTMLSIDIYMNQSIVDTLTWENGTDLFVPLSTYVPAIGFYHFVVNVTASGNDSFISAISTIDLLVIDDVSSTETSDDTNTSTSSNTATNQTDGTSSVDTPQLELSYPTLLVMVIPGLAIGILRRREK